MLINKTSITFTSNALANQGQATSAVQNTNNASCLASISAKDVKEKNPESTVITINNIAKLQNKNKEKRIILVDAGKPGDSIYGNTLAIALNIVKKIASNHGYTNKEFHLNRSQAWQNALETIKPGDIVALTSSSPGAFQALELARAVKAKFGEKVLIIKGGTHERLSSPVEQLKTNYPIDISFIGDAEIDFEKLLDVVEGHRNNPRNQERLKQKLESINHIRYFGRQRTDDYKLRGPTAIQMEIPDRPEPEMQFTIFKDPKPGSHMHRIMSLRGCPFTCTFCEISTKSRRASAKYFVEKIEEVVRKSYEGDNPKPIGYLFLEDGNFVTKNSKNGLRDRNIDLAGADNYSSDIWIEQFTELMKALNQRLKAEGKEELKFAIQTRSDTLITTRADQAEGEYEQVIQKLKEAGLDAVYIGVDNTTGKNQFGKSTEPNDHLRAVDFLKSTGVESSCSTILVPRQEQETIDLIEKLMNKGVQEIFTEYLKVFIDTADSRRVVDETEKQLSKDDIVALYTQGKYNMKSASKEDNACLIVEPAGDKLKLVSDKELETLSHETYNTIADLAKKYNYRVLNHGHYVRQTQVGL